MLRSTVKLNVYLQSSNAQARKRVTLTKRFPVRHLQTTSVRWLDVDPLKPSSKVEASVLTFKHDTGKKPSDVGVKPSLATRIVDELKHYYHGFRLLFVDVRISSSLLARLLQGEALSRREKKQLVRTTSDVFRLVPFSVFIIVPFMELTLPIFLKLFPNMLPSTFQTANEADAKLKKSLKLKLEMAKFLQQTLDEMALKSDGRESKTAKEFAEFFIRIRSSGQQASNEEILRFSKLFEDEITLDSLTRPQLIALCRVLELAPLGTNSLLRFQLRMRLRSLAADDKVIQKEGIDSLSINELQAACRARGMRSLGVSEIRLRSQLHQWLALSLDEKVPPSLLLLSRALYLPDTDSASEQLVVAIASLPETVAAQTKEAISQRRGKTDNQARIEMLKIEEAMIREERKDTAASAPVAMPDERLVDKAPVIVDRATLLTQADVASLETALENIGVQKKQLLIEKKELTGLKEEMTEYQEDIAELKEFLKSPEQKQLILRESTAARRLYRSVNSMIRRLDGTVNMLERRISRQYSDSAPESEGVVSIEEIAASIERLQAVENSAKLRQIVNILNQVDTDNDGRVSVDEVMKVIGLLEEKEIFMSPKQMAEILDIVNKEEILELEQKVGKSVAIRRSDQLKKPVEYVQPSNALEGKQEVSIEHIPIESFGKPVPITPVVNQSMALQPIDIAVMESILAFRRERQQIPFDNRTDIAPKSEPFRARAGSTSGLQ